MSKKPETLTGRKEDAAATAPLLPLIAEPSELEAVLDAEDLLIVDLCPREVFDDLRVPGAVHLEHAQLVSGAPPAEGDLPADAALSAVLSSIGMQPKSHVVAYDDEGGGWAGRLLWTLEVGGHTRFSLLNGGICAWLTEGHPTSDEDSEPSPPPTPSNYTYSRGAHGWVDKDYIIERLGDPSIAILDARSAAEYNGQDVRAKRAGHIPGAVNLNWTNAMDQARRLRIKPKNVLEQMLLELGVTPDKEVIVYCQTHHRSSHTYIMLKALGFADVKAYPGSWSEWGNCADTPIE